MSSGRPIHMLPPAGGHIMPCCGTPRLTAAREVQPTTRDPDGVTCPAWAGTPPMVRRAKVALASEPAGITSEDVGRLTYERRLRESVEELLAYAEGYGLTDGWSGVARELASDIPYGWEPSGAYALLRAVDPDGKRRTTQLRAGDVMLWERAGMVVAAAVATVRALWRLGPDHDDRRDT